MAENMTIEKTISYLGRHKHFVDIEFQVAENPKKKISAHKLILAISSPLFADVFYGNYQDPDFYVITEPVGFRNMLWFLYTGELPPLSGLALTVNAARKYSVKFLETAIFDYILQYREPIKSQNVLYLLDAAIVFKIDEISEECLYFISNNTKVCLLDGFPKEILQETVLQILTLAHLSLDSIVLLLLATIKWLEANQISESRDFVLSHLDIMSLSIEEFSDVVAKHPNFFHNWEIASILMNMESPNCRELPSFCNSKIRTLYYLHNCNCHIKTRFIIDNFHWTDVKNQENVDNVDFLFKLTLLEQYPFVPKNLIKIGLNFGPHEIKLNDVDFQVFQNGTLDNRQQMSHSLEVVKTRSRLIYELILNEPIVLQVGKSINVSLHINYNGNKGYFKKIPNLQNNYKSLSALKELPIKLELLSNSNSICLINLVNELKFIISWLQFESCFEKNSENCIFRQICGEV